MTPEEMFNEYMADVTDAGAVTPEIRAKWNAIVSELPESKRDNLAERLSTEISRRQIPVVGAHEPKPEKVEVSRSAAQQKLL